MFDWRTYKFLPSHFLSSFNFHDILAFNTTENTHCIPIASQPPPALYFTSSYMPNPMHMIERQSWPMKVGFSSHTDVVFRFQDMNMYRPVKMLYWSMIYLKGLTYSAGVRSDSNMGTVPVFEIIGCLYYVYLLHVPLDLLRSVFHAELSAQGEQDQSPPVHCSCCTGTWK